MAEPTQVRCARCGSIGPASFAFCTECGTRRVAGQIQPPPSTPPADVTLAKAPAPDADVTARRPAPAGSPDTDTTVPAWAARPAPAPSPAPPLPPAGPTVPRRRSGPVLLLLALLLLAAGGVGGVLLAQDSDSPSADPPGGDLAPSSATSSSTSASTPEAGPQTVVAETARVRCWDGADAATVEDCRELRGYPALDWVFPNAEALAERCEPLRTDVRVATVCWAANGERMFTVSDWNYRSLGANYYRREAAGAGPMTLDEGRLRWSIPPRPSGGSETALMYPGLTFGITVYADSAAALEDLVGQVEMRPLGIVRRYSR